LRALRKRKPQETQALALTSSQSWLPLLRPSIPIGWRLRLLRDLPMQALAFPAVFVYATQAIAFEWEPGLIQHWVCHYFGRGQLGTYIDLQWTAVYVRV